MPSLARAQSIAMTLLAALVAVLLGACDGSPSDPPPAGGSASRQPDARSVAEPDPSQQRPAEVSWSRRLDVIGQPVDAGPRVLVVLARTAGRVELVGLDRASGRTTFSVPFHPGGTPSGVALSPKVTATDAGRVLAIVRRTAGGPLQAVDVRTGDVVRSTPVAIDDYDACSDGTDVCWSGYDSGPNEFGYSTGGGPMRWDLETGRVRENDGQEAARIVGTPDLYVRGEGRTATIMRLTGGQRTRWSQSVSLTVAPGADPSHGWSFSHDEKSDVYVGALGRPVAPALVRAFHAGKRVEIDYGYHYI